MPLLGPPRGITDMSSLLIEIFQSWHVHSDRLESVIVTWILVRDESRKQHVADLSEKDPEQHI